MRKILLLIYKQIKICKFV